MAKKMSSGKRYSSTVGLVWGLGLSFKTKFAITKTLLLKRVQDIDWLDLLVMTIVLCSLYIIPKNNAGWMLYAFGCSLCMILMIGKKLYFQAVMNFVALVIAVGNFIRG